MKAGPAGKFLTGLALLFSMNAALAQSHKPGRISEQTLRLAPFVLPTASQVPQSNYFKNRQPSQINRMNQNFNSMDNADCGLEIFYDSASGEFTMNINGEFVDPQNPDILTGLDLDMSVQSHFMKGSPAPNSPNQEIQIKKLNFINQQYADVEIHIAGYHGSPNQQGAVISPIDNSNTNISYIGNRTRVRIYDMKTRELLTSPYAAASEIKSRTSMGTLATITHPKFIDTQAKTVKPVAQVINFSN